MSRRTQGNETGAAGTAGAAGTSGAAGASGDDKTASGEAGRDSSVEMGREMDRGSSDETRKASAAAADPAPQSRLTDAHLAAFRRHAEAVLDRAGLRKAVAAGALPLVVYERCAAWTPEEIDALGRELGSL